MKTIELFQWDLNQKIPCQFPEVHFASIGSSDALIVSADGGNASIPNILLQEPKDIMVWFMRDDAVADSGKIRIIPRAKPADYVYTETEVITFESLVAKVEDVIAKANTAVDNATTAANKADEAANKAEAAVSKLPLPLGNTLKGEVEATLVNVDDAYPAPLITTKVMGQSNQVTTTGRNLVNHAVPLNPEGTAPFIGEKLNNGFVIDSTLETVVKRITTMKVLGGIKAGDTIIVSCNYKKLSGDIESPSFYLSDEPQEYGIVINKPYIVKNNHSLVGIYLDEGTNSKMEITDVQLIKGSTPIAYEPYTGGKPSPSPEYPQEITNLNNAEIVTCGKNLINVGTIQSNRFNEQFNDAEMLSELNKLPRNIPLWLSCNVEPKGINNGEIWFEGEGNNKLGIMRQDKAYIVPEGEIKSFRLIGGINDISTRTYSNIQIAAVKSDFTNSDKAKHTPIDLKGNELCSLPHGVKDEVVIDAEGNVSLIKRTKQYSWNCVQIINGTGRNYAVDKVLDIGANYTGLVAEKAINATNNDIGICYVNQKKIYVTVPESVTTKEQANQLYGGMKVIYQLAEPQTIPLGKVELPVLPESTSNVWNDGNIPANVYIQYLKDVNIAYGKLESQLSQMAMALSMMDTPTVIPEISEDEPTLIPELEESPIEEPSITK